jgi:Holliday junction DNA helicase RuvA
MLAWLEGLVLHIEQNEIVLNVNGVGYRVVVGDNLQRSFTEGKKATVIVYTSVKEDEIRLFGFENFEARRMFILLLGVNGIGPKVGQKIIDQIPVTQIVRAILDSNHSEFLKVSGVGKKTAQRLVIDLQGKLNSLEFSAKNDEDSSDCKRSAVLTTQRVLLDAKSALSNLGFTEREIERAISRYIKPEIGLDDLIRRALSDLNQTVN